MRKNLEIHLKVFISLQIITMCVCILVNTYLFLVGEIFPLNFYWIMPVIVFCSQIFVILINPILDWIFDLQLRIMQNVHRLDKKELIMKKDKNHCCKLYCNNEAEFEVKNPSKDASYEDYTHACGEHLAGMIYLDEVIVRKL